MNIMKIGLATASKLAVVAAMIMVFMIGNVNAYWRLECDGSVGLARLDPLMNFGTVGDHVHSIKGGSAFTSTSTAEDLMKSKCASCGVKQDHSAYWTPALYFLNSDSNTWEVVPEKPPHKTYYLLNSGLTSNGKSQKIEAFPNGFQMISGHNFNRNSSLPTAQDPNVRYQAPLADMGPWKEPQDVLAQRALGFNCMNYQQGVTPEPTLARHSFPDKAFLDAHCPDGLRLELMFPSCWNGEKDSADHKSHVAFPDSVMSGDCPAGFDRRLPSLMYETIVATDHFKGRNGKFVISNGDPTGFGYHGDFIAAWDDGVLQQAVDTCTAITGPTAGDMRACPVFEMAQGTDQCHMEKPLPDAISSENCKGPMSSLPNDMHVYPGPEPAPKPGKKQPKTQPPKEAVSKTSAQVIPTIAVSSHAAAGFVDVKNNVAQETPFTSSTAAPSPISSSAGVAQAKNYVAQVSAPTPSSPSPPPPPPTSTPAPEPSEGSPAGGQVQAIATTYSTKGHEVYEDVVMMTETTVTVPAAAKRTPEAGNQAHKRHAHRHLKHHGIGGRRLR